MRPPALGFDMLSESEELAVPMAQLRASARG